MMKGLKKFAGWLMAVMMTVAVTGCHSTKRTASPKYPSTDHTTPAVTVPTHVPRSKDMIEAQRRLMGEADKWLGVPYRYGGDSRNGVDCSGLVLCIFQSALDVKLPRSSAEQMDFCTPIGRDDMTEGDLLFFITGSGNKVSHVGMYVGNGLMIHSSTSRGVVMTPVDSDYFARRYHSSGRVGALQARLAAAKAAKAPAPMPQAVARHTEETTAAHPQKKLPSTKREEERGALERAISEKSDSILNAFFD